MPWLHLIFDAYEDYKAKREQDARERAEREAAEAREAIEREAAEREMAAALERGGSRRRP